MKHLDLRFVVLIPAIFIIGVWLGYAVWTSQLPVIGKILISLLDGVLLLLLEIICFQCIWDWSKE